MDSTTQCRLLEAELKFYKRALDAHAIVAITDPKGAITYVNHKFCEISKYPSSELIGQNHRILNSGHHPRKFFKQMYATIGRGNVWQGEIKNRAKDGSFYWVDTTIVPMLNGAGRPSAYFAIRRDITDREEMIRAKTLAENSNRIKSEFIANVSHEIRTPMSAILGFADLIADPTIPPGQHQNYIDAISRNANHLLELINDILDLSKIEAEHMQVESIPTRVEALARDVLDMMLPRANAKGIELSLELDPDAPPSFQTDPVRLRQIITNLLGNAVKFTETGSVRVQIRPDTDERPATGIAILVSDTGIGMNDQQSSMIFMPFAQGDSTTTRRFGGTGIGLHICERLAKMLGGTITFKSELGVGSTFVLTIPNITVGPLLHAGAHPAVPASSEPLPDLPLAGTRVLLAEDGPDNQQLITFYLNRAGATVETANNGKIAIEMIRESQNPFDVILMDMQMPELDGYDATKQLRSDGETTPIIAITAHAMTGDRDTCIAAGCDDYLAKPIDRERLIRSCWTWAKQASAAPDPVA